MRAKAAELQSDGCSGVPDFYLECCLEHDIHYRTGKTLDGKPLSRAEADARLWLCIVRRSVLGLLSPMAWWRWLGVRWLGRRAWRGVTA